MRIDQSQWIVSGLIAAMTLAFVLGVWMPESRSIRQSRERILAAEVSLGPNFNQPTALAERQRSVDLLRDQLAASDRHVPQGPETAALLLSLAEATQASGVVDPQTQTAEARHHLLFSEIPVELEAGGDFASIYRLLSSVESMPRLVRVDALNLRRARGGVGDAATDPPKMRMSMRVNSFFTPAEEIRP